MNDNHTEIFGKIVRASRDSGLKIPSKYAKGLGLPKQLTEEQQAIKSFVETLNKNQLDDLEKCVKYCIELSLFKLISSLESGVAEYSFELSIERGDEKKLLISKDVDNELSSEFWNWVK